MFLMNEFPLYGAYTTVTVRFYPWLSGKTFKVVASSLGSGMWRGELQGDLAHERPPHRPGSPFDPGHMLLWGLRGWRFLPSEVACGYLSAKDI